MQADEAILHLQSARSGIRRAQEQWDPADLSCVENSRQLLVGAVHELRLFESAVRTGDVPPTAELGATVLAVKGEVMQATRVVDACLAFHRGLAARTGGAPPVYDAEGHIACETHELESEVHA
jgi:hypothetical protein